uniref:Uncharacterized protein n=1 Tax=Parascaris equorum TaxID=6256 RepID=A0A914R5U0_PAREQ
LAYSQYFFYWKCRFCRIDVYFSFRLIYFWYISVNITIRGFFLQIIQSPKNRWRRLTSEATRPGPYPVALISGQFHQHYKKFSPEELRRLPFGTILDYEYLLPPKRGTSPPPVIVHDEELLSPLSNEADQDTLPTLQSLLMYVLMMVSLYSLCYSFDLFCVECGQFSL